MIVLLGIGLGGMLGAVGRYFLGRLIMEKWKGTYPLGTFLINISGAYILCFLLAYLSHGVTFSPVLKSALTTGFLGAYTTFSTFAYEVVKLLEDNEKLTAIGYTCSTVFFGLTFGWLGYLTGNML
ncbi:camphor resistance protein CrcB [Thermacetogenium phaeum DSM 12270]|jgi:CrcB protein|uniref:Fluoride-specific ion channel FluC n=1 Tax=Thermacetogenium phaeum (strain ATCC BAA-254 / DSM 26808 / PB) TaxID=1089553 RepID=K4LHK9_THEPS|nr:fluoride efflux transporter CrcB [Thermacetogenium phaeum]AFV11557.1 camphor resistance protein CrcB [Thermacetogenium phaeum DSM 12270]